MNVLITQTWDKSLVTNYGEYEKRLTERGFSVRLHKCHTWIPEEELIESLYDVDVFMCGLGVITKKVLDSCPKLKMISKFGVGLESVDIPACTMHGVAVTNCPGCATDAVAEFTLALILDAARGVTRNDRKAHSGLWEKTVGVSVVNRTVGIVGFGRIGRRLARMLSGFNVRILAYSRNLDLELGRKYNVEMTTLDRLAAESDIISLHVPLTQETKGMVDAKFLSRMKKGSVLINTARGPVVDDAALYEALYSRHLYAAALDVHNKEPMDLSNPLFSLDNCIITTHNATSSYDGRNSIMEHCVQNVLDIDDGIIPKGLANPEVFEGRPVGLC